MKKITLNILIALTFFSIACTKGETPNEGAAVIRDLIKEKNYEALFPARYSEWHKTEKEGMEESEAISKLSDMFEKRHEVYVSIFEQLTEAEFTISQSESPQISETGKVASTVIEVNSREVPFKLYEMTNGIWGFHL
jgi:hypothetical protein